VINWCPRCATSLSDLELEYREVEGTLYYIRYPIIIEKSKVQNSKSKTDSKFIVVATTRPETMLGDAAVAVNPKDERYQNLIGQRALLPLQNREIPIIADAAVEKEFGTGAVKVTPAHDLLDAEIGERHKLPKYKVIGPDGKMTQEAGSLCEGLKADECRARVVEELKQLGLLEKEEAYKHRVAQCYRCSTKIEPIPSIQWFLKMEELAKMAIGAVKSGKVRFHPKRWEKVYLDWLKNVKDWCISRQIWWGHRLPVYFCKNKPEGNSNFQVPNSKQFENWKLKIENSSADSFVVSATKPETCPFCKQCSMIQSSDVLDTWFSSALWPFATLGWPTACAKIQNSKFKIQNYQCTLLRGSDLATFYPTSVLSTARDIINLWVARMVFSGLEFMGKEPFQDVIIHATILTKEGKRMSKSLGTGIDPMDLVARYGADATRFGLIWQAMGNQDIHWSEEHVVAGKKFCNKIWNASRFVLGQIGKFKIQNLKFKIQNPKQLTTADKKILAALGKTKKEVTRRMEKYEFGQALHALYDFFWHEFCDVYLEASKSQIQNPAEGVASQLYQASQSQTSTQQILLYVLAESLKLLHPFIPFITEEIWGRLPLNNKKLLIIESWPK